MTLPGFRFDAGSARLDCLEAGCEPPAFAPSRFRSAPVHGQKRQSGWAAAFTRRVVSGFSFHR